MIKINAIDHVGIRVMAFEPAIAFYEKLGFTVTRWDKKEHVVVIKHACGIELNLLDSGNDPNQQQNILMDMECKYPGYTHYAMAVESLDETKHYLESLKITISGGPVTFGDGKTSLFIRDPDKNVIELTQLPGV